MGEGLCQDSSRHFIVPQTRLSVLPDDIPVVSDDDSRVPYRVAVRSVTFEDGTDDNHAPIPGISLAEQAKQR